MVSIPSKDLPVLYADYNLDEGFPVPGSFFCPTLFSDKKLFGVIPKYNKYSESSLYILDFGYGPNRKLFLMQMLHKITDTDSTPSVPDGNNPIHNAYSDQGILIPSIAICALADWYKEEDSTVNRVDSRMIVFEHNPSIQQLEIDIKLFAEVLRAKAHTYDFLAMKMKENTLTASRTPLELISFPSIPTYSMDKSAEQYFFGPYYLVYSLAGVLLRNLDDWSTFWSQSVEGRWDYLTNILVSLYGSSAPSISWKDEATLVRSISTPEEEPKRKKKKEPAPTSVERVQTERSPQDLVSDLKISDDDKKKLLYEMKKLESSTGQERNNLMDWINQVTSFPWAKTTGHPIDFSLLRREMDLTHYGLPEVKDALLEHMVIEAISGKKMGGVLCFTGPAGTGKTSIAKTLARASGRKCFSLPLGGVTDEAEIRGHRRTYVSAKAGRIVNMLQQAGCIDPVIILDEIDKSPFKGNYSPVTSSLLEVLDPQQNKNFLDKYFEIPIDLSNVMFICTSNESESIPAALKDRMEIVQFRDYTTEERNVILTKYMLPNILKEYCLESYPIEIHPSAIDVLVKEVRLRQIEIRLRGLLKKCATRIFLKEVDSVVIDAKFIRGVSNDQNQKTTSKIGFR